MWTALIIAIGAVLLAFTFLTIFFIANSPGKVEPFLDQNGNPLEGSISEKTFITIGGIEQGIFLRGKDADKPVLLYLHGGPSFSEYFLVEKYPTGWEDEFVVCYWDQRGGGMSASPDIPTETMTMDQLLLDTVELTEYLRNRFGKEKIYLAAHSGGTIFGIQAAAQYPELYHAYIGIAQITNQRESEKIAYQYLLSQYEERGDSPMVAKLQKHPVLQDESAIPDFFKSVLRDQAMHELGVGTMRNMHSISRDIAWPIMLCKAYTLGEKINLWRSKIFFVNKTSLKEEALNTDLTTRVNSLKIPVYFFGGAWDLTVNTDLSKAYLEKLDAPVKAFYTFEHSAHSPNYEEPDKMMEIIRKNVLKREDLVEYMEVETPIYKIKIPSQWEYRIFDGDRMEFLNQENQVGGVEVFGFGPDQAISSLTPNHSEIISQEEIKDYQGKAIKVELILTQPAASGDSSKQYEVHYYFIQENIAFDIFFNQEETNSEAVASITKSFAPSL